MEALEALMLLLFIKLATCNNNNFIFNGFHGANVSLDGSADITSNGLLKLTNGTKQQGGAATSQEGHAFYKTPVLFKDSPNATAIYSFSTTFVFSIVPVDPDFNGHGIAFVVSPTNDLSSGLPAYYLGVFNSTNNGNKSNHIFAIELDTSMNPEFGDIDNNHVGIDVNGLRSIKAAHVAYFVASDGGFKNLSISTGDPIQIWIEYDGSMAQLNVTIAPIHVPKPTVPLISMTVDLSDVLRQSMYVGFSAAIGTLSASHYILGWSFMTNGQAQSLDLSALPKLPRIGPKKESKVITIGLPLIITFSMLAIVSGFIFMLTRKIKYAEILEEWERQYGPHRFSYIDLFKATKGFKDTQLLGIGGFGRVYRGILPGSKIEVAVKKVSHESRQGMKEFIAEIVSLGRLRHRNLVQLLGYCRRKGELLLVYDFMPNGSLDKFLFQEKKNLDWRQRVRIIKGVASGLVYLHEEWEQVVIHRDIKSSNILLDENFNGRLGDFGLARLYDHGTDPQTTHIVGTLGYLAPELARTGKSTTWSDVFAFGTFMLEVVTGRRAVSAPSSIEDHVLVDWVAECGRKGAILEVADPKLGSDFNEEEMELVLKLGLFCSHQVPAARPSMRQVLQILDGDTSFPELASDGSTIVGFGQSEFGRSERFNDMVISFPSSFASGASFPSATSSLSLEVVRSK